MFAEAEKLKTKDGRELMLRCGEKEDAQAMMDGFIAVCGESDNLSRGSEEAGQGMTLEGEEAFIQSGLDDPRSLTLLAFVDGEYAGNGSFNPAMPFSRMAHRCVLGLALLEKYCSVGVGEAMLRKLMAEAKKLGYETMELEVTENNLRARGLYEKLGFTPYGRLENSMKYPDGSYKNSIYMVKKL